MHKIGNSIDIHRLIRNKPLYIGGVLIPSKRGALAHSDGDALLHCLCEAILGALGKGDLGSNFPDSDDKYKDIRSTYFINECKKMLNDENYHISNIDIMIVLQRPKLTEYKEKISENIARILEIDTNIVNIKAGTNEKIGRIGRNKSYLVWCSVLVEKNKGVY